MTGIKCMGRSVAREWSSFTSMEVPGVWDRAEEWFSHGVEILGLRCVFFVVVSFSPLLRPDCIYCEVLVRASVAVAFAICGVI